MSVASVSSNQTIATRAQPISCFDSIWETITNFVSSIWEQIKAWVCCCYPSEPTVAPPLTTLETRPSLSLNQIEHQIEQRRCEIERSLGGRDVVTIFPHQRFIDDIIRLEMAFNSVATLQVQIHEGEVDSEATEEEQNDDEDVYRHEDDLNVEFVLIKIPGVTPDQMLLEMRNNSSGYAALLYCAADTPNGALTEWHTRNENIPNIPPQFDPQALIIDLMQPTRMLR